jgi:hypothetical protein
MSQPTMATSSAPTSSTRSSPSRSSSGRPQPPALTLPPAPPAELCATAHHCPAPVFCPAIVLVAPGPPRPLPVPLPFFPISSSRSTIGPLTSGPAPPDLAQSGYRVSNETCP